MAKPFFPFCCETFMVIMIASFNTLYARLSFLKVKFGLADHDLLTALLPLLHGAVTTRFFFLLLMPG